MSHGYYSFLNAPFIYCIVVLLVDGFSPQNCVLLSYCGKIAYLRPVGVPHTRAGSGMLHHFPTSPRV